MMSGGEPDRRAVCMRVGRPSATVISSFTVVPGLAASNVAANSRARVWLQLGVHHVRLSSEVAPPHATEITAATTSQAARAARRTRPMVISRQSGARGGQPSNGVQLRAAIDHLHQFDAIAVWIFDPGLNV